MGHVRHARFLPLRSVDRRFDEVVPRTDELLIQPEMRRFLQGGRTQTEAVDLPWTGVGQRHQYRRMGRPDDLTALGARRIAQGFQKLELLGRRQRRFRFFEDEKALFRQSFVEEMEKAFAVRRTKMAWPWRS